MSSATDRPVIVYVPGLRPKPEAGPHHRWLQRCLVAGVEKIDREVASALADRDAFELIDWTYDFYGEHRDFSLDQRDIEALLQKSVADDKDRQDAVTWQRRVRRWAHTLADFMPALIPHLASENAAVHVRDFVRYLDNKEGAADDVRQKLKDVLVDAFEQKRRTLLLGHSMGSVIAYDALWELSHVDHSSLCIDFLMTAGSPLGQKFVQRRLMGWKKEPKRRYPLNIAEWVNIAAVGDLTALDMRFGNDFAGMLGQGVTRRITDHRCHNFYRVDGELSPHAEYGYLANVVTAREVVRWWRGGDVPGHCER